MDCQKIIRCGIISRKSESFVRKLGQRIAGVLIFLYAKSGHFLAWWGHFYAQSPARIPAVKCEITVGGFDRIKSPAVPQHCGDDVEIKTGHLIPTMSPLPTAPWGPGLQLTGA